MDIDPRREARCTPPNNLTYRQQEAWEQRHDMITVFDTDLGNGWTATATVVPDAHQRPLIDTLLVWSERSDPRPIPAKLFRFKMGAFKEEIDLYIRTLPYPEGFVVDGVKYFADEEKLEVVSSAGFDLDYVADAPDPAVGRPPVPEAELLEVAVKYDEAMRDKSTRRSPKVYVADNLGLSHGAAGDRISKARERGFLTAAPGRGMAGGRLTDKARALLDSIKEEDPQ